MPGPAVANWQHFAPDNRYHPQSFPTLAGIAGLLRPRATRCRWYVRRIVRTVATHRDIDT